MKFIVLIVCTLKYIQGLVTFKMIAEANKHILKGDELEFSIVNPVFAYFYRDIIFFRSRNYYFDKNPSYKDLIKMIFSEYQSDTILSVALTTLFPLTKGIISTPNLSNSSLLRTYFPPEDCRESSIGVFSLFFYVLLKKDNIFETENNSYSNLKRLIVDFGLVKILDKDIGENQKTLAFTLLTLNAFMLEVLETEDELKKYVSKIINHLSDEDKKNIKASSDYFFKFNKVESEVDEKTIINTLYNISYCKYPYNFNKQPTEGIQIPTYDKRSDKYNENSRFEDSVEIALLHLCNVLFYNEEKEQFDLEHLQLDEDSDLLKFYTKYKRPFNASLNIRNEWSKVVQCLDDVNINDKKYNENLGRIVYANNFPRNKLDSSILNIVTVLTKICSSKNNDIEETYIKLFDAEFKADSVSDLVQEFLNCNVNKSVNLKCEGESIEVKDNLIYGKLHITTVKNNEEKLKTKISFTFDKNDTKVIFIDKDYLFIDELKTLSFKIKNDKEFNPLEHILAIFVDELKDKLIKK